VARESSGDEVEGAFAGVGCSANSSLCWEVNALANERALLSNEATLRATSRVTKAGELCRKKHKIAPRAQYRTWRRNIHSPGVLPVPLVVSLLVGFGSAFLHRTSN